MSGVTRKNWKKKKKREVITKKKPKEKNMKNESKVSCFLTITYTVGQPGDLVCRKQSDLADLAEIDTLVP